MSTYATRTELEARLSSAYTLPDPDDAAKLLAKASELIDYKCQGRAERLWLDGLAANDDLRALLADATCDQVEYWLETGEESDVLGLSGSLMGGRVQVQHVPGELGPRARRTLTRAQVYWSGAAAF